ncbi:glutathione S-transferase 1-like [Agrilus planipennis]|uniref:Glutathione S-transferase 1-like n=1 Tax=Agrilus planipennis TaxID=224129 RepID=A0A1W4XBK2_AGRPL|nr:glutathione S-transferase 1-like [Agrilus planipennis]
MPPTLYYFEASPAVRSVLLTSKALGMNLILEPVNILKNEHLRPDYLKINPQHTVPTLVDEDGFSIWDSHAINAYLIGKYGKDDSLYPRDPKERAVVDQRLHFDSGILFAKLDPITKEIWFGESKSITENHVAAIKEAYSFLETFLSIENESYIAGNSLTIADFSLIASVTTMEMFVPICPQLYPKLTAWIQRIESLPYYNSANQNGLNVYAEEVKKRCGR